VTEENLRQFFRYNIPKKKKKKTITKSEPAKKRSDTPPSLRPVAKKRPLGRAEETSKDVPLRKKRVIPLAALGAKRILRGCPWLEPTPKRDQRAFGVLFRKSLRLERLTLCPLLA
jgi:hypothetical protein